MPRKNVDHGRKRQRTKARNQGMDVVKIFHGCALNGRADLLYSILSTKPDHCKMIDASGCTALHWACTQGHLSCIRVLILAGADPWTQDNKGRTALHVAAKFGHLDACLELLDAAGLQLIEVTDEEGKNAADTALGDKDSPDTQMHVDVLTELERLEPICARRKSSYLIRQRRFNKPTTPTATQPPLQASTPDEISTLKSIPPIREVILQPGLQISRLPSMLSIVWIAAIIWALNSTTTVPQLPQLPARLADIIMYSHYLLPVVLFLFLATSVADAGCYTAETVDRIRREQAASATERGVDKDMLDSVVEQSDEDGDVGEVKDITPGDESIEDALKRDGVDADVSHDDDATVDSVEYSCSGSEGFVRHPFLDRGHWELICVAHRLVLPQTAGYDRVTGYIVEGYSTHSPMNCNLVGTGNRVQYWGTNVVMLIVTACGSFVAGRRMMEVIEVVGAVKAVWTWLYLACAVLFVSFVMCLGPVISSTMMLCFQDLPIMFAIVRKKLTWHKKIKSG